MPVRVGDLSRHRPASALVEQAFRSFGEDRVEEQQCFPRQPARDSGEAAAGKQDTVTDRERRPA